MDFKSCVFNTYVPGIPFVLYWVADIKGISLRHMTTRYVAPCSFNQSAQSKHTCSCSSDRSLNSLTHSYIPTDTHPHMEMQPVLHFFGGVGGWAMGGRGIFLSNSLSVTHTQTFTWRNSRTHIFLTCCLRRHHLSSINVTFHKAAIDNSWSYFKTHLSADVYITPLCRHTCEQVNR